MSGGTIAAASMLHSASAFATICDLRRASLILATESRHFRFGALHRAAAPALISISASARGDSGVGGAEEEITTRKAAMKAKKAAKKNDPRRHMVRRFCSVVVLPRCLPAFARSS